MKWLRNLLKKLFGKKPSPQPEPEPDGHNNGTTAGYTLRLKTYEPPHKDRRFSVKLDKRFHTEQGLTESNSAVTVDDIALQFYGIDQENGRYDLSFCDKFRHHNTLPKPVLMRIYKGTTLITVASIPEWEGGAVVVEKSVKEG